MKTQRNQSGRLRLLLRRPPGGALPHSILLYSLLIPVSAGLIAACARHVPDYADNDQVTVTPDSCSFRIGFSIENSISESPLPVARLDLFAYDADRVGELLDSRRYDHLPDSVLLYGSDRGRLIVAIANSPHDFNDGALARYDSIELLTYDFEDDSPPQPLMSGMCEVAAGGSASVTLTPLMARVQLGEISNCMTGYTRLENPRLYLDNMNASAEVLRTVGFRPTETLSDPRPTPLPYDVGIFPQNPGTELFCYPNDTPGTIGTPATALVLECEIRGATCRFTTPIPSIPRNSTTRIDLTVSGPSTFESKIY